jgi:hypothetical protein
MQRTRGNEDLWFVLVPLAKGSVGLGFRCDHADTVDLLVENLSPESAIQCLADLTEGRIEIEALTLRPMRSIPLPFQDEPPLAFIYPLPQEDEEVTIAGMAIALLDQITLPPADDARAMENRALFHYEQSQAHARVPLTNDADGFKHLFVHAYTRTSETSPLPLPHLLPRLRLLLHSHPPGVVLAAIRSLLIDILFPPCDLPLLTTEYQGTLITLHRALVGFYAALTRQGSVHRTPAFPSPFPALEEALLIIDPLKHTEEKEERL